MINCLLRVLHVPPFFFFELKSRTKQETELKRGRWQSILSSSYNNHIILRELANPSLTLAFPPIACVLQYFDAISYFKAQISILFSHMPIECASSHVVIAGWRGRCSILLLLLSRWGRGYGVRRRDGGCRLPLRAWRGRHGDRLPVALVSTRGEGGRRQVGVNVVVLGCGGLWLLL